MSDLSGSTSHAPIRLRTRWDDCDRNGHVNNAVFAALIRAAHQRAELPAGRLRALTINYREPVGPDTELEVDVTPPEEVTSHRRIAYVFRVNGRRVADAETVWHVSGPDFDVPLSRSSSDAGGRPFGFAHVVRSYEVGPDGAVGPQAILQWLEHAVFRAAARSGWPATRMSAVGFLSLVIGHELVLGRPAAEGDEVDITSRPVEVRRVSGAWHHEVRKRDGALVAADRARGAFLDLHGRIHPAPPELLRDLLRGEPSG
ncbi:MAG: hotdog domain-containing protein [Chloroflexota bacterium]